MGHLPFPLSISWIKGCIDLLNKNPVRNLQYDLKNKSLDKGEFKFIKCNKQH